MKIYFINDIFKSFYITNEDNLNKQEIYNFIKNEIVIKIILKEVYKHIYNSIFPTLSIEEQSEIIIEEVFNNALKKFNLEI